MVFVLARCSVPLFLIDLSPISCADLKLENVLFTHNTLQEVVVDHGGKACTVKVPVNTNIKRTLLFMFLTLTFSCEHYMCSFLDFT